MELNVCRICCADSDLISVFDQVDGVPIRYQLAQIADVKTTNDDNFPKYICAACTEKLVACLEFKCQIEFSYKKFRECYESVECWEVSIDDVDDAIDPILQINCDEYNEEPDDKSADLSIPSSAHAVNGRAQSTDLPPVPSKHPCKLCGKVYSNKLRLIKHRQKRHPPKDQTLHKCETCGKLLATQRTLELHHRLHTGEKPYACPFCGKRFLQSSGLAIHKRLHTGEKPFSCIVCLKEFKSRPHLKYHLIQKHTGEKPHLCSACGKRFASKSDLTKHEDIHSAEKAFKCKECDASFVRIDNFQRHMLRHSDEKNYKCELCGRSFRRKYDVTQHMKHHNRIKAKQT